MEQGRLAVIDLDGTLVYGNTFRIYFRLGLQQLLASGRILSAMAVSSMTLLRALRLISHKKLKFFAFRRFKVSKADFVSKVKFNDKVLSLISQFEQDGIKVLLATAAADVYVPWIWHGDYIATDLNSITEMRGNHKLNAVQHFMKENNLSLYAVVTDHHDDLPLLQAGAQRNILISPSSETIKQTAKIPNLQILGEDS